MGFGPEPGGLTFTKFFDGTEDSPTDFPWAFESPLPFTVIAQFYFSPLLTNAQSEDYVYVIDRGQNFWKYNITKKHWTELSSPNYTCANTRRNLALSPNGEKLACPSEDDGRRLEIYDIASDSWTATDQAPDIATYAAYISSCVWADDDILWCIASRATQNRGKFLKYTVSTTTWDQFATDSGATNSWNGKNCAISPDGLNLFASNIGDNVSYYLKYVIATDTYSTDLITGDRQWVSCPDRSRLWVYRNGPSYRLGYLRVSDESLQSDIFPLNDEMSGGLAYATGVNTALTKAIQQARGTSPKIMSYIGTGYWKLVEKTLTQFNMILFEKPDDGYAIIAINVASGFCIPVFNYDTKILLAGTWTFYYPKDGDYTDLKLYYALLEG